MLVHFLAQLVRKMTHCIKETCRYFAKYQHSKLSRQFIAIRIPDLPSLHPHHADGLVRDGVAYGGHLRGEGPHGKGLGARPLGQQQRAQEALVVALLHLVAVRFDYKNISFERSPT